jgi:hypothetical protein
MLLEKRETHTNKLPEASGHHCLREKREDMPYLREETCLGGISIKHQNGTDQPTDLPTH